MNNNNNYIIYHIYNSKIYRGRYINPHIIKANRSN